MSSNCKPLFYCTGEHKGCEEFAQEGKSVDWVSCKFFQINNGCTNKPSNFEACIKYMEEFSGKKVRLIDKNVEINDFKVI